MGVEEKKATRSFDELLQNEAIPKMKEVTGNSAIEFELKIADGMSANQISIASDNIKNEFLGMFCTVCEDADYREEIAKINRYTFDVHADIEKNMEFYLFTEYKLEDEGQAITIKFDGTHLMSNNDGASFEKSFKAVF